MATTSVSKVLSPAPGPVKNVEASAAPQQKERTAKAFKQTVNRDLTAAAAPSKKPIPEKKPTRGDAVYAEVQRCRDEFLAYREQVRQNPPTGEDIETAKQKVRELTSAWKEQILAFRLWGATAAVRAAEQEFLQTFPKQEFPPEDLTTTIHRHKQEFLDEREANGRFSMKGYAIRERWQKAVETFRKEGEESAARMAVEEFMRFTGTELEPFPSAQTEPAPAAIQTPSQITVQPQAQLQAQLPAPVPAPRKFFGFTLPDFLQPAAKAEDKPALAAKQEPQKELLQKPAAPVTVAIDEVAEYPALLPLPEHVEADAAEMPIQQPINNPLNEAAEQVFAGKERLPLRERLELAEEAVRTKGHLYYDGQLQQALHQKLIEQEALHCRQAFSETLAASTASAYLMVLRSSFPDSTVKEILEQALCQNSGEFRYKGAVLIPAIMKYRAEYLAIEGKGEEADRLKLQISMRWQGRLEALCYLGNPEATQKLIDDFARVTSRVILAKPLESQPIIMPQLPLPSAPEMLLEHEEPALDTASLSLTPTMDLEPEIRLAPAPMLSSHRMSYVECMFPKAPKEGLEWFASLPMGVQYRLYENICSERSGTYETLLSKLQEEMPGKLYSAVFKNGILPFKKAPFNAEFMRNKLYTEFVERRLRKTSGSLREEMNQIHTLVIIYGSVSKEETLRSRLERIDESTRQFLTNDKTFLRFVEEQAKALGNDVASGWAKEHCFDDPWIFFEALTRWYDLQPIEE